MLPESFGVTTATDGGVEGGFMNELQLRDGDRLIAAYDLDAKKLQLTFEGCGAMGGHCWEGTGITSDPPQYPEVCKHCGATRTGTPRYPMEYTEPKEVS